MNNEIRVNGAWSDDRGINIVDRRGILEVMAKTEFAKSNNSGGKDSSTNIGLNDVCVIEEVKKRDPLLNKTALMKNNYTNDNGSNQSDSEKNQQLSNDSISKTYRTAQEKGAIAKNTPFKDFANWFNEDPGRSLDLINKAVELGFSIDAQIKASKGKPQPAEETTPVDEQTKILGMSPALAIGVGVGVVAVLVVGGMLLYRVVAKSNEQA
jgi:hypothetical protein